MHTRQDLVRDLHALGIAPGDVVMVHASVRAVGEVAGGPDEIHLAVRDAVSPGGSMFMYASCPQYVDEVGRGEHSPEKEREIIEKLPPFDPQTARSARDNGALVEMMRTYPGSRVNDHPARFVVWGPHADRLLAPQPWDFAFGAGSLLERFLHLGGKILLLGSDHDTVTFLHYVEHVADFPGKRIARFQVPILDGGKRVWKEMAEYDTSSRGVHANWPSDCFAQMVDGFLVATGNVGGRVGHAMSFVLDSRALTDYATDFMKTLAAR